MKIIIILLSISMLVSCDIQDADDNDYDHTIAYLNLKCDLNGEIRYYPSDKGGYCMKCEYNFWREFYCSDFPR